MRTKPRARRGARGEPAANGDRSPCPCLKAQAGCSCHIGNTHDASRNKPLPSAGNSIHLALQKLQLATPCQAALPAWCPAAPQAFAAAYIRPTAHHGEAAAHLDQIPHPSQAQYPGASSAAAELNMRLYLGQGGATARVVNDVGHHALNVGMALRGVKHTVLGGALAMGVVGLEHRPPTLTLGPDNAPHLRAERWERQDQAAPEDADYSGKEAASCWGCQKHATSHAILQCYMLLKLFIAPVRTPPPPARALGREVPLSASQRLPRHGP